MKGPIGVINICDTQCSRSYIVAEVRVGPGGGVGCGEDVKTSLSCLKREISFPNIGPLVFWTSPSYLFLLPGF